MLITKNRFLKALLLLCLLIVSCKGGASNSAPEAPELGVTVQSLPEWELYYTDASMMRYRKKGSEATVDIVAHSLGAGNTYENFDSFLRQFAHVPESSTLVEDIETAIDGIKAKRITTTKQRVDTGETILGIKYFLEHNSKAYAFSYLDAGAQIEANSKEAVSIIESIKFKN